MQFLFQTEELDREHDDFEHLADQANASDPEDQLQKYKMEFAIYYWKIPVVGF